MYNPLDELVKKLHIIVLLYISNKNPLASYYSETKTFSFSTKE